MSEPDTNTARPTWRSHLRPKRNALLAGAAIVLLAAGAATGAGGIRIAQLWQPQSVMLLQPTPINTLREDTAIAAKGNVAEIFGNKFILQDGSGRALVDLGPRGEYGKPVMAGETVTVQGRFERGVIRAQVLAYADGRSVAFGPPGDGPRGPEPKGKKGKKGPDREPPWAERAPPPPPPVADRAPPPSGADRAPPPPPPPADAAPPPAPPRP